MSTETVEGAGRRVLSIRRRVWELVEVVQGETPSSRVFDAFDVFILVLILLNVIAVILESVAELEAQYGALFFGFEAFSVAVFTVEYVARLWSCVEDPAYARPVTGRIRFALRPLVIIDLLAILPIFLSLGRVDLRFVRALRLFRIARVAKAGRYVTALALFRRVVKNKREELVLTTGLMVVLLVMASALMYFAEGQAQPDKFSSIPASMWWAVATLTTVGYGDVYPITPLGRVAGAVIAILGIGFFALPTAIIGSGFVEAVQETRGPRVCSHCGHPVES